MKSKKNRKYKSKKYKSKKYKIKRTYGGMSLIGKLDLGDMAEKAKAAAEKAGAGGLLDKAKAEAEKLKGKLPEGAMDNITKGVKGIATNAKAAAKSLGVSNKDIAGASSMLKDAAGAGGFGALAGAAGAGGEQSQEEAEREINKKLALKPSSGVVAVLKDVIKTLITISGSVLSLPVRNLDELIPPELCNKVFKNDVVCTQSMLNFLFSGTKPDHRKILLDENSAKKKCIQYDEKGNKFVQCKKGGYTKVKKTKPKPKTRKQFKSFFKELTFKGLYSGKKYKGGSGTEDKPETKPEDKDGYSGIIIECKKVRGLTFKVNDRVILKSKKGLLSGDLKGDSYMMGDEKWFIGTVKSIKGSTSFVMEIKIDHGGIVTCDNEDDMAPYTEEWKHFCDRIYSIFPDKKTRFSRGLSIFTMPSEMMIRMFIKLSTNPQTILTGLQKDTNIYANELFEKLKKSKDAADIKSAEMIKAFDEKTRAIFDGMCHIADRVVHSGESLEGIFRQIKANEDEFAEAINKKLDVILDKLIKVNLYLRKYECPRKKLQYLLDNVNDKELLKSMLTMCDNLLGKENFYGKEEDNRKRGVECDNLYNKHKRVGMKDLEIDAEAIYTEWWRSDLEKLLPFDIAPESTKCATCKQPWANLLGKYGCLTSSALLGSRSDINYIIMNILLDMSSSQSGLDNNDEIKKNITDILKNIECRSDLRSLIKDRIKELENPKRIS